MKWLILVLAFCTLLAASADAQTVPFGKNKIQYRSFQWQVISGEQVDVYFYPEEERLARLTLGHAEETFRLLERRFRHHPFERIPLIVYASHRHFEQTNLYPGFIPEGVLGFTEYLKRRVSLPFRGDYAQFLQTLRHELVHAFQISKLAEVQALHPARRPRFSPKQVHWWTEGLAEFWSGDQTVEDDMYIRDMVLDGRVPDLREFGRLVSFASYPLGAELHRYLAGRFGEQYIARMYEEFWKHDSFEQALQAVLGTDLDRLGEEWKKGLQHRYFPDSGERSPPEVAAVPVIYRGGANFKPALLVPPGDTAAHLFFVSPRSGYATIYRAPLEQGEDSVAVVLEGEKSAEFESLQLFESRIAIHPGGTLAFVSKHNDRDALFLLDTRSRSIVGRYQWPDLVGLRSPAWHPDGARIVFEGLSTAGYSDLYIIDFRTQQRIPLTADHYRDRDPDWSPDGRTIVFASDRTTFGREGYSNLFLLDLEGGAIRYLTRGPWNDQHPRWSRDGRRIAFSSERAGAADLHVVDTAGRGRRLTALTGGAFDPDWLPDDEGLVFTGFGSGGFRIFRFAFGEDTLVAPTFSLETQRREDGSGLLPMGWDWAEVRPTLLPDVEPRLYGSWRRISLDVAGGDAFIAPGVGAAQGAQFLASDMLGNHILFGGVSAVQASSFGELFDDISGTLLYLNLSNRLNFGAALFRFNGIFRDVAFDAYRERSFGALFLASYPFSRFERLEWQIGVERSARREAELPLDGVFFGPVDAVPARDLTRSGVVTRNRVSFVRDNTLWLATGPIDGERFQLSAGFVTCFACRLPARDGGESSREAAPEHFTLSADYRRYTRLARATAYAIRAYGFYSGGVIPARAILGGTHMLRGYPRYSLAGARVGLLNQEVRFPLLDPFRLALPFGRVPLPGIQAALFTDLGSSWLEGERPRGAWGSYGFGLRAGLGIPLVLRMDLGRRFRFGDPPPIALGGGKGFDDRFVDVFFGYNY